MPNQSRRTRMIRASLLAILFLGLAGCVTPLPEEANCEVEAPNCPHEACYNWTEGSLDYFEIINAMDVEGDAEIRVELQDRYGVVYPENTTFWSAEATLPPGKYYGDDHNWARFPFDETLPEMEWKVLIWVNGVFLEGYREYYEPCSDNCGVMIERDGVAAPWCQDDSDYEEG